MSWKERILEHPTLYSLWQAPFAKKKLGPLLGRLDLARTRSVLDVGCGPGISTAVFAGCERYLGVDIHRGYVEHARRKHRREFLVSDALALSPSAVGRFDLILMNSLLHHLDDEQTARLLARLVDCLAPGGQIHIIDLLLPPEPNLAQALARMDRGQHARSLSCWTALFTQHYSCLHAEQFELGLGPLVLWNMTYFQGAR